MKRFWRNAAAQIVLFVIFTLSAYSCPECRALTRSQVFDHSFGTNLFVVVLPVAVIVAVGIGIYFAEDVKSGLRNLTQKS